MNSTSSSSGDRVARGWIDGRIGCKNLVDLVDSGVSKETSGKEPPLGGSEDDETGGSATLTVYQNRKEWREPIKGSKIENQGNQSN